MGPRILIVDDLPFMRAALRRALTEARLEVAGEASDGREGVHRYLSLRPDIVLMDIAMPVMDGLTALRQILRQDPGARIVMCSAMGEDEMIMESIRLGAKDFIVKPFRPERVVAVVRRIAPPGPRPAGVDGAATERRS